MRKINFCYESPRRCGSVSPTRTSLQPLDRNTKASFSALSQLLGNETCKEREILTDEVLDSIPKRDWRLLAALVHKREERDERERLADEFKKLWSEEKELNEQLEAEASEQYRRYVSNQREADRRWLEQRRSSRCREVQLQRAKLLDVIQYKERKSADLLATLDDRKITILAERSLEEDVRGFLAAQRRARLGAAGEWRRRGAAAAAARRGDEARQRREARLHDSARRALIGNALSSWECSLMRHEIETLDAVKRASAAARLADAEERGRKVNRARYQRQSRAKRAARAAELLRAAVIGYRR